MESELGDLNLNAVWLGITDSESSDNTMTSYISQLEPQYQNWGYGEPSEEFIGGRCAAWRSSDKDTLDDSWSAARCGNRNFVTCMKQQGNQCPSGWTYHQTENGGKCYLYIVNGAGATTWYTGRNYCKAIGAEMITPATQIEMDTLARYFDQWSRGGVTRFWVGVSNVYSQNSGECDMRTESGGYLDIPTEFWSADYPETGCNAADDINSNGDKEDTCAFVNTLTGSVTGSWQTGSCFGHDAYGCQIEAGGHIHDIANDDRIQYHCEVLIFFKVICGHSPIILVFIRK